MKKLLLTIGILIQTLQSFAQTTNLYGTVMDPNSHPVDFSTIQLISSKSKTSTLTDENGDFKFIHIEGGSIRISVKRLGYFEIDTSLDLDNTDTNFVLLIMRPSSLIVDTEVVWIGFSAKRAEADIKNKLFRILLPSGLLLHKLPGDESFEKKYNVSFYNRCEQVDKESIMAYNQVVFKYLDKTFGKRWRKEVRQDLVGL